MLLKVLTVECTDCHFNYEVDNSDIDFDDWVYKENCPKCKKLVVEKLQGE